MPRIIASAVDFLSYKSLSDYVVEGGLTGGRRWWFMGQTGNTVATNVANQSVGTVAVPALAAGATGTITISDSLISTGSIVIALVIRRGTTTPAAGAVAALICAAQAPGSGSIVIDVRNIGSAATLSTDYQLHYWIANK